MNIQERARLFARAAHLATGQKRKYTGAPYHTHTESVAAMVEEYGGSPEMVAAAHLHDTVEDTELTVEDIYTEFGSVVAVYVHMLTDQFADPEIGNRAHRKALELGRLAGIYPDAQTIKYADLIDNTRSIARHDPDFARVYLKEKRAILNDMTQGDRRLWRRAWATMADAEASLL